MSKELRSLGLTCEAKGTMIEAVHAKIPVVPQCHLVSLSQSSLYDAEASAARSQRR